MPRSHHHRKHDEDTALTDDDRIAMRAEIDDLGTLLLTCQDTGLIRELERARRHLADELEAGRRLPVGQDTSIWYDYEIAPLSDYTGAAGWKLRLLRDGLVVGGGIFPVIGDGGSFLLWWKPLNEEMRTQWLMRTATGSAAEAYLIYLLDEAWHDAAKAAGEWLESRHQDKGSKV